jgi:hypothetical protein
MEVMDAFTEGLLKYANKEPYERRIQISSSIFVVKKPVFREIFQNKKLEKINLFLGL